jgi:hypothetical protein
LIIEGKFLILFDIPESEDADANLSENIPLLGDAVGFAGVVDEAC